MERDLAMHNWIIPRVTADVLWKSQRAQASHKTGSGLGSDISIILTGCQSGRAED